MGIDISQKAIWNAIAVADKKNLLLKYPKFRVGDGGLNVVRPGEFFDLIWAHSVLTHLPIEVVTTLFRDLSQLDFSEFYFTYKEAVAYQRSGLKQFQYSPQELMRIAEENNLKAEAIPEEWPAGQKTMKVTKA